MDQTPLWTVKETAVFFRRHQRTIYRWLDDGQFPNAFKVRDGHFIPFEDVQRLRGGGFVHRWKREC